MNKHKRKIWFCAVIIIAVVLVIFTEALAPRTDASASDLDLVSYRVLDGGILRCGYVIYPPYTQKDPVIDNLTGLNVDLMEVVAQKASFRVEWTEETGWGTMIEGLVSGRYDAVCSPVWQNTQRARQVEFSLPYGFSRIDAWVRADETRFSSDISSFDREDARISTIDGEMGGILASALFPKAPHVSLPQMAPFSDALLNVVSGKADIALVEPQIAKDFLDAHPNSLKNVTASQPLSIMPITLLLPRHNPRLKTVIDSALQELIYTRQIEMLLQRYDPEKEIFFLPVLPYQ